MNRRQFLSRMGIAGAGLAVGASAALGQEERKKRPNILFLLTDDQRWDAMSCMGHPILKTPNMDRLAKEGRLFENAFVTTPICAASRASIFLGQYECRHDFTFGKEKIISWPAWEQSYPMLLKKAGYRTGFIGKFGVKVDWKEHGGPRGTFDFWKPGGGRYFPKKENPNGQEERHLTQIMGEHALDFLKRCSKDKPFCLSVSFKAPHVQDKDPRQFLYDPAYKDLYADMTMPKAKTATPKHFEALPKFIQESLGRKRWGFRFSTPEQYQEMVKGYYRLVHGVDVVVGRVLAELEKQGLADNTVVIYASDNGFFLGEHGMAGKWLLYEESIRVPLIIADPRAPAALRGQRLKQMALNVDIAPTILELAGVPVPNTVQGHSLRPLLDGRRVDWREDFLCEHLWKVKMIPRCEGVRTGRWKYIRYIAENPVYEQLFDLQTDPLEETNLAGDPRYQSTLRELRNRCDELKNRWSK
ncbi:MAG: sulfatase [Planctomycetes bacterium]|nr:sulfatase [Planctomycetota bacterium]